MLHFYKEMNYMAKDVKWILGETFQTNELFGKSFCVENHGDCPHINRFYLIWSNNNIEFLRKYTAIISFNNENEPMCYVYKEQKNIEGSKTNLRICWYQQLQYLEKGWFLSNNMMIIPADCFNCHFKSSSHSMFPSTLSSYFLSSSLQSNQKHKITKAHSSKD